MSEIKKTEFARGVPKAEKNGFYGIEAQLIADPEKPIVAIVTFGVDEVVEKHLKDETYPIVAPRHIEPLHDQESIDAALKLQIAAREARGDVELPMPDEPDIDLDKPLDEKDAD